MEVAQRREEFRMVRGDSDRQTEEVAGSGKIFAGKRGVRPTEDGVEQGHRRGAERQRDRGLGLRSKLGPPSEICGQECRWIGSDIWRITMVSKFQTRRGKCLIKYL
jgi:hypothetical protein